MNEMMSKIPMIWRDGELMAQEDMCVSPFDLGVTVGLGVFETMQAYDGKVFAYARHHERLLNGLLRLEFSPQSLAAIEVIEDAMRQVLVANHLDLGLARVRVSLSGGVNPLSGGQALGHLTVTAAPVSSPCSEAKLVTVPYPYNERSALAGIKSSSYADHLMAWRHALSMGADEAVRYNTVGKLCEGAMSNIFIVSGGKVLTPSLESGCLPGITRAIVIELCKQEGIDAMECDLTEDDLNQADEIFITSSVREVQSAELIGNNRSATKPITQQLARAYRDLVKRSIGS
jgi:branched-chain amino acid aminotransferase